MFTSAIYERIMNQIVADMAADAEMQDKMISKQKRKLQNAQLYKGIQFLKCQPQSYVKEEIIISDSSDDSGDEAADKADYLTTIVEIISSDEWSDADHDYSADHFGAGENRLPSFEQKLCKRIENDYKDNTSKTKLALLDVTNKSGNTPIDSLHEEVFNNTSIADAASELRIVLQRLPLSGNNERAVLLPAVHVTHESDLQSAEHLSSTIQESKAESESQKNSMPDHYNCNYCDYKHNDKSVVTRHMRQHHLHPSLDAEGFATCKKCKKKYRGTASLRSHEALCNPQKRNGTLFSCDYCPYKTPWVKYLYDHINNKHANQRPSGRTLVTCPKCQVQYEGIMRMKSHLKFCGKPEYLQCKICLHPTKNRFGMKRHIRRLHPDISITKLGEILDEIVKDAEERMKCGDGTAKPSGPSNVWIPLQRNRNSLRRFLLLYCPRCKETCERLPVKISQICPKCGALRFNQCKACNGQFGSYDTAKNHLLNNSMECLPQVELSCHDCNYKHCNKDRLRTHIRRTHLNALPKHAYKCNRCTKTYQSFCAMRSHNRVCGRPKNIKCEFCDFYKTNDYSKLKTHIIGQHMMLSAAIENERDKSSSLPEIDDFIRTYCERCNTTIKPAISSNNGYSRKCPKCRGQAKLCCRQFPMCRRFYDRVPKLREHVERDHFGERQYECKLCPAKLASAPKLKEHKSVCGMDSAVICKNCDFSMTYANWLYWQEQAKRHAGNDSPSADCHDCCHKSTAKAVLSRDSNSIVFASNLYEFSKD